MTELICMTIEEDGTKPLMEKNWRNFKIGKLIRSEFRRLSAIMIN